MIEMALVVVQAWRLNHHAAAHDPAKNLFELFDAFADLDLDGRDWIQVSERDLEWQLHQGSPLSRGFQDHLSRFPATVSPTMCITTRCSSKQATRLIVAAR